MTELMTDQQAPDDPGGVPSDPDEVREQMHAPSEFARASRAVVDFLDEHLPMGVWMVSRHVEGKQLYVHVTDRVYGVGPGDSHPWDDSYCVRMLAGDGPRVAPDAAAVPAYREAGVNDLVDIGTYVGVPVAPDGDGGAFGTLCGLSPRASDEALLAQEPMLQLLGDMLGHVLVAEQRAIGLGRAALEHLDAASRDALTGLPNRRGWDEAITRQRRACVDRGASAMVLYADLDELKATNDRDGHEAGDAMIRRAAALLLDATRPEDVVARIGGDEFAVLLADVESYRADEVVARIESTLDAGGAPMSIGAAQMSLFHGMSDVMRRADTAMYRSKARRHGARG